MTENFKEHLLSHLDGIPPLSQCERCKKEVEVLFSNFYTAGNPLELKHITWSQSVVFYWMVKKDNKLLHAGNRAAFEEISTLMEIKK